MSSQSQIDDENYMRRALTLAGVGEGDVEPNPMVGAVIVRGDVVLGVGYHQKFGGPHAEVNALAACTDSPRGATLYVTLEPCCHHGKTPPCVAAILNAGISRVVVALEDPYPEVSGKGIAALKASGIQVEVGLLASESKFLLAPYLKRVKTAKPWVIAKWAMTLDGKIAARDGSSKWITSEASRLPVHELRGRVDGILVGSGTAILDDPMLTARLPNTRTPTRVILDRSLKSPASLQVFQTARETPTILFTAQSSWGEEQVKLLQNIGVEVVALQSTESTQQIDELLTNLGKRNWTNLLIEGGGQVLGAFVDAKAIDEVNVFVAPKLIGGAGAVSPVGGVGLAPISEAIEFESVETDIYGEDLYFRGRVKQPAIR